MFVMKQLNMMYRGQHPTEAELKRLNKAYLFCKHTKILCHITPKFLKMLDNNVLVDENQRRICFDIDSKSKSEANDDEHDDMY